MKYADKVEAGYLRHRWGRKELANDNLEHAHAEALASGLYDHPGPWSVAPLSPLEALEVLEHLEKNGTAEQVEAFRSVYFGE
jgi:hypothetical protein